MLRSSFLGSSIGVEATEEKDPVGSTVNLHMEVPDMSMRKGVSIVCEALEFLYR